MKPNCAKGSKLKPTMAKAMSDAGKPNNWTKPTKRPKGASAK